MYPLLLKPLIKNYIWGGTRLKTDFGFQFKNENAAEAWMLSCRKDGTNIVLNGEHKDKTINEVLDIWGKAALGKKAEAFNFFPILIKLIDAKQKLSLQVHPNDDYALYVEGEYGKTEMWYVVDCKEGAELVYGFKEDISKEEFERRIKDNTLTNVCNVVPVNKGDVFFIPAGTLHAIGEGILIAEIQQNSNTTYRISDYGRLGQDGKLRELHIEKAVDVTNCEISNIPYGNIGKITLNGKNIIRELAVCDKFTAKLLKLNEPVEICSIDSFISLIVLDGNMRITCNKTNVIDVKKGDSIFIPAGLKIELSGKAEILYSHI